MNNLLEILLLFALAISGISFTITITSIFEGVRKWVSSFGPKWDQLIHCPWCLSHYIAFGFVLGLLLRSEFSWAFSIIFYFAVITVSGLCHYVLLRAYEPVAKLAGIRKLEALKQKKNG